MQLKKRDAASKESLEDAENAYALAKAEVTELESQIRQARIAVNTDEVNLGYTRITAPLDGTIVSVPVDEGQTVNANQTTPTIVQIADLDKMEIKIESPRATLRRSSRVCPSPIPSFPIPRRNTRPP